MLDNVAFPCTEIKAGGPSADRTVPTKASSQVKEKISADPVYIGLDSEWVQRGDHNLVLSVQLAMRHRGAEFPPRIFYTKPALEILRPGDPENKKAPDRFLPRSVIAEYIIAAKQEGFLTRWPKSVHLAAHWTRSDLPHFVDSRTIKYQLDSVGKTYATVAKSVPISFCHRGRCHRIAVQLVTTTLLAPGTSKSLDRIGSLYDRPKIELPDGTIGRMDLLLRDDPKLFARYAVQDAVITELHADEIKIFAIDDLHLNIEKTPVTLSSIAIKYMLEFWKKQPEINPAYLNDKREERQVIYLIILVKS